MLTHIVCWKYKAETTDKQKSEHVKKLRALQGMIPDIISFNVGADILHLDRSFDTGLVAVYPDTDALERYNVHEEHIKVVLLGNEIAERVVSVDFMSVPPA